MKFSEAEALYCDKDCGLGWLDNEYGCQSYDADAFCKLKYCDTNFHALSFEITNASNHPGFACRGVGNNFGRSFKPYQGIMNVYYVEDMKAAHGGGNVVSNITCVNKTSKYNVCKYTPLHVSKLYMIN